MATATNDKPLRLGDLPVVKTNILENARQFDKGVVGGYNGVFPLSTASKGGIYLLPSTGKFYVCETAYNGAQISAPNSNFVELSVWKNHDRLSNLYTYEEIDLKKKYPNNFPNVTVAKIYKKAQNIILTIDTGVPIKEKKLYSFPEELKYLMPSNFVFSVLCDGNRNSLPVFIDPWNLSIETYATDMKFFSALYGQINWLISNK